MTGRKRYTKEFKLDAVSLVLEQGHTRTEVARMLDVSQQIIGRWVKEFQQDDDGQAINVLCERLVKFRCHRKLWDENKTHLHNLI